MTFIDATLVPRPSIKPRKLIIERLAKVFNPAQPPSAALYEGAIIEMLDGSNDEMIKAEKVAYWANTVREIWRERGHFEGLVGKVTAYHDKVSVDRQNPHGKTNMPSEPWLRVSFHVHKKTKLVFHETSVSIKAKYVKVVDQNIYESLVMDI